jgi:hypothetical protein
VKGEEGSWSQAGVAKARVRKKLAMREISKAAQQIAGADGR